MTTRFDAECWICEVQQDIVMFGGKGSAPSPPDYTPVAQADAASAEKSFELGQEQLQFAKDQFNTIYPYAQQYLTSQIGATNQNQANAQNAQQFYESTYKPIESSFANEALTYNTPERANENAGRAVADVANTFEAQRRAAQSQLESYGIDPSQTRFGALDLSTRISQAAAEAAAGTQSRLNTEATALGLQGEAINVGRGYPGAVAQSYATATDAGKSGLGGANSTFATGANAMGSPTSYLGDSAAFGANQAQALNYGFNNAATSAQIKNQNSANFASGLGNLIGGGVGAALTFL